MITNARGGAKSESKRDDPSIPNEAADHSGGDSQARISRVGIVVSVGALTALILHIAEPTWKIDSVAIALLVVAALPWLGDIFESIDLPGGPGVRYRERLKNVEEKADRAEEKAARAEEQLALLDDIFPLLLPDNVLKHLQHLENAKTKDYHGRGNPLRQELRQLRYMHLIKVREGRTGISAVPDDGRFDLAEYVELTDPGRAWIERARELKAFHARRLQR